ncbi:hypothetical protein MICRO116_140032 [Micrococcus sp. 116]|nr:hypothetical protein MICRO116_140032 [Micrococcus sp. 116]
MGRPCCCRSRHPHRTERPHPTPVTHGSTDCRGEALALSDRQQVVPPPPRGFPFQPQTSSTHDPNRTEGASP